MIPRHGFFARKGAKRRDDELSPTRLADRATLSVLKDDLAREILELRVEIMRLKEKRNRLVRDVKSARRTDNRAGQRSPTSRTHIRQRPPVQSPPSGITLRGSCPAQNNTAWRKADRKAQVVEFVPKCRSFPPPAIWYPPTVPPADRRPTARPRAQGDPKQVQKGPRHAPSWATWDSDPGFLPSPLLAKPNLLLLPLDSHGLFGPRNLRNSLY